MILSKDIFMREFKASYEELWCLATIIYGPNSSNVLLQRNSSCTFVNEGSTVLRELKSHNRLRSVIETIIQQSALKTKEDCGDGTTTTLILTLTLLKEGFKLINAGVSTPRLIEQIRKTSDLVCSALSESSKPVEEDDLTYLALSSSKGEQEVSEHIVKATLEVGEDGFILIEEGKGVGVITEYRAGIKLFTVPCSHSFLDGGAKKTLEGCLVATIQTPMTSFEDVKYLLECASQWKGNPLLIITTSYVTGVALDTILLNNSKGISDCTVIHITEAPEMRIESLRDVASLCGSNVVEPLQGSHLKEFKKEWLGTLRKATITQKDLTAIPYDEEAGGCSWVESRVHQLEGSLSISEGSKSKSYRHRIAQLTEGLCRIEIGATTNQERKIKLAKAENTVQSLNCALKKGVLIGGGNTLAYYGHHIKVSNAGEEVMAKALKAPFQILNGNGLNLEEIDLKEGFGFDCLTGSFRHLMKESKVITPTHLLICAIKNSVSVASTLLLSEKVVLK